MNFYLIDGSALFYRAYFAFIKNPLINSKGENVSAVFGFANSIFKILRTEKPDFICVAFDRREPTFRHEMYPDYKAHREKMPEDLSSQLPTIFDFVEKLGIGQVSKPGFEADDIIGTLCASAERKGLDTYIVSGDKDFLQLISDKIHFFNIKALSRNDEPKILNDDYIKEKYGITHERMKDYLALTGDASDNIPGVMGVGKITAAKLLNQYKSLECIYDKIDGVKPESVKKKLIAGKENAFLSRRLVNIITDIDLNVEIESFKNPVEYSSELYSWIQQNEFQSLKKYFNIKQIKNLEQTKDHEKNTKPSHSQVLSSEIIYNEIQEGNVLKELLSAKNDKENVIILCSKDNDGEDYITFSFEKHNYVLKLSLIKRDLKLKTEVKNFLGGEFNLIGFDIKELLKLFWKYDVICSPFIYDICLAGFLLSPERKNPDLKELYEKYMGALDEQLNIEPLFHSPTGIDSSFKKALLCMKLYPVIKKRISESGINDLLYNIELPLITVLAYMEHDGILVDSHFLEKLGKNFQKEIQDYAKIIHDFSGEDFNINSPKQLGEVLFEKLEIQKDFGIKKLKKTKTGYSTSSETLIKYRGIPIIEAILRYRTLTKLQSTYVSPLQEQTHAESGRIHCSFNQMVTVTGRLSSKNPNLQNIPIRTSEGALLRKAFIAENGFSLVSADYSQIELRILAHLSGDPFMLESFEMDKDIHAETAAKVFNIKLEDVSTEQRSKAKAVNFGVVYGMGPYKLSQDTGMNISEAKQFIENYFRIYKGVRHYIDEQIQHVKKIEKTRTLFGRVRYLNDINSTRKDKQILAEHMAVNTPIQGTAADLIKVAMIRIHSNLKKKKLKSRLILQVHDELILEVADKEKNEVMKMVKYEMENVLLLRVPLKVSIGGGANWLEAH